MPTVETTLTPINGAEAKKILKNLMDKKIEEIPLLKEGNAFKQIEIGFELICSAFPADCPVPSAEWQILMGLNTGEDLEFDKDKKKIEVLLSKRQEMIDNITRIDKFLSKHNPTEIVKEVDRDNGIPDEMRERNNLKIPVIQTSTRGTKSEIMLGAAQLRTNNVAKKG